MKNLTLFLSLFIIVNFAFADNYTYFKGPSLIQSNASIVSSGGTTQLDAISQMKIAVTGTNTHEIKLPNTASVAVGVSYQILNKSTQSVTVVDFDDVPVETILTAQDKTFILFSGGNWLVSSGGGAGKTLVAGNGITIDQDSTTATISSSGKALVAVSPIVLTQDASTATFAFAGINVDELLDVDTGTPSEGNTLTFNSSMNKWVASAPQVAAGSAQWLYPWSASSTTNSAYLKLDYQPQSISEVSATVTVPSGTPVLIGTWIYDSEYGDTSVPAGEWTVDFFSSLDSTVGNTWITATVFARTSTGIETSLFTLTLPDVNSTSIVEQVKKTISQAYAVNATDKIGVKIYANTDAATPKTLTFYWGDATHYSRYSGPFIPRHNNLRGLQGGSAGEYYHLNQAKYNAAQNLTASGTMTLFTGDTQTATGNCTYYGDSVTDGSHRSCQVGGALIYSKRVSGSWSETFRVE